MKRNYGIDLLRIVLCISVIALHAFDFFGKMSYFSSITLPVLLIAANGLFFMLSGYFNLEKEFKNVSDIKKFYKSRFITILLPFLAFVFVWQIWDLRSTNILADIPGFLFTFYESIMDTTANTHLWFLYPLFGMVLSTPFLSKMLHSMDDNELKMLWHISIGFNVLVYILCLNFGVDNRLLGWIFIGWPIYYFLGYYYRHVIVKENAIKWIVLGSIGFVVTVLGMRGMIPFFVSYAGANDISPFFTLFCIGYLVLWNKVVVINNEKIGKVISFIAKYTFFIYMFHMRGIGYAVGKLGITTFNVGNGLLVVLGSFVFSLVASIIMDLLLKPIQKLIEKIWIIR